MFATGLIRWSYQRIAKPWFFRRDPEDVHDRMCRLGAWLGRHAATRAVTSALFSYDHPMLEQELAGIHFSNPVGLAAGFDKNAELTRIMSMVGFGYEEVGSITGEACAGNPRPRLWRLPISKGLVVYYGLKNDGCEAIAPRLRQETLVRPIGISIAKTSSPLCAETRAGIEDYLKALRCLRGIGSYLTLNVSCPNAYGGEPFTDPDRLEQLLTDVDRLECREPIFLKLPVDLTTAELDALVAVADRHRVQGMILSNLTKRKDAPGLDEEEAKTITKGGVSGKPVFAPSNALIAHLYRTTQGRYIIVGCGGIFTAEDAYEKIRQGASLVQLITGMIFEGPQVIGEINRGLVRLLQRDGYASVREAVGSAHLDLNTSKRDAFATPETTRTLKE